MRKAFRIVVIDNEGVRSGCKLPLQLLQRHDWLTGAVGDLKLVADTYDKLGENHSDEKIDLRVLAGSYEDEEYGMNFDAAHEQFLKELQKEPLALFIDIDFSQNPPGPMDPRWSGNTSIEAKRYQSDADERYQSVKAGVQSFALKAVDEAFTVLFSAQEATERCRRMAREFNRRWKVVEVGDVERSEPEAMNDLKGHLEKAQKKIFTKLPPHAQQACVRAVENDSLEDFPLGGDGWSLGTLFPTFWNRVARGDSDACAEWSDLLRRWRKTFPMCIKELFSHPVRAHGWTVACMDVVEGLEVELKDAKVSGYPLLRTRAEWSRCRQEVERLEECRDCLVGALRANGLSEAIIKRFGCSAGLYPGDLVYLDEMMSGNARHRTETGCEFRYDDQGEALTLEWVSCGECQGRSAQHRKAVATKLKNARIWGRALEDNGISDMAVLVFGRYCGELEFFPEAEIAGLRAWIQGSVLEVETVPAAGFAGWRIRLPKLA